MSPYPKGLDRLEDQMDFIATPLCRKQIYALQKQPLLPCATGHETSGAERLIKSNNGLDMILQYVMSYVNCKQYKHTVEIYIVKLKQSFS